MRAQPLWLLPLASFGNGCQSPASPPVPPIPVSELRREVHSVVRYERREVPAAQNGWALLDKIGKVKVGAAGRDLEASLGVGDLRADPKMLAQAKRQVAAYAPMVALTEKALARRAWQVPLPKGAVVLDFLAFATTKNAAKALVLRAHVRLAERKPDAAARDLIAAREIALRLYDSESAYIGFLVAVVVEAIGNRAIQRAAFHPAMTPRALRTLLQAIRPTSSVDTYHQKAMRSEFNGFFLPEIAKMPLPEPKPRKSPPEDLAAVTGRILEGHPHPFDRRVTVREASALLAESIRNAARSWSAQVDVEARAERFSRGWPTEILEAALDEVEISPARETQARKALRGVSNAYGRLAVSRSVPVVSGTQISFRQRADREATRVTLALRLYRLRHGGKLPPNLAALVSAGILKTVPRDPFSGRPLRYDPVRKVVWSVGPNGSDEGGKGTPGRFADDKADYVWSVAGLWPNQRS